MSLPQPVAVIGLEVVSPAVVPAVGVGEDFQDEDASGIVVNGGDEAVVIFVSFT